MSKEEVVAEVAGLQISNNTFSASPPGSLAVAEECVMPQKGVIEPRRGQSNGATLATSATLPFALAPFDGNVIASYATSRTSTSYGLGYTSGGGSVTAFSGIYNPVDCDGSNENFGRIKFAAAGEYLHFCTNEEPKVLEAVTETPRASGLLRMPDPIVTLQSATYLGTTGVGLAYGESRAYRTVLRLPTSNGTSLLSPPSGPFVVQNRLLAEVGAMTRAGATVTVTFDINPDRTLAWVDIGDTFELTPGEANFPAGTYTVTNTNPGAGTIQYADAGAAVSNTVEQDLDVGERPVFIGAYLPSDATEETPVRLYRSLDTLAASPSDEMFLTDERYPDSSDISAGAVQFNDIIPQEVLFDPLYTNPLTGEGAKQANFKPPIYRDNAVFDGKTWYANTTGFQQLRIQMLGVGSPDGVQDGDTLTIDNELFTFKTAANISNHDEVQIVSSGLYSFNVRETSYNFVRAVRLAMEDASKPIRAYYESAGDSAAGQILLESFDYADTAWEVTASRPESWTPAFPTDSTAERMLNGLADSKPGQPEAVPVVNYRRIGSANYPILRILSLQQALLVCKGGDGIFAVTGTAPYTVQQISTANLTARDAACVFADAAWLYTDQGILRVSDSGGATVVSRPIETELNRLLNLRPEDTADWSFAVPYEQERRVLFFVPFDENDDGRPLLRAWCFNSATNAWTGPLYYDATCGAVAPIDSTVRRVRLYLGLYDHSFSTSRVTVERNGQQPGFKDYIDTSSTTTISAIDVGGDPLVIKLASVTGLEPGDLLTQGDPKTATIRQMRTDLGPNYVEVYQDVPFTASSVSVAKHYDVTLQFQPQGNPTARKTLTRLAWLLRPEQFASLASSTLLATDQLQDNAEIPTTFGGFGWSGFGSTPFGDPSPLVCDVTLGKLRAEGAQFFVGFTMPVAWSKLKLQGFAMTLDTASGASGRGSNR